MKRLIFVLITLCVYSSICSQIPRLFDNDNFIEWTEVKRNGKIGYVDSVGDVKIPCEYELISAVIDGIRMVRKDGLYGFIDIDGKILTPCIYDNARVFENGMAPVSRNGKWGFVDTTGKEIIPCVYYEVSNFHNDYACVKKGNAGNQWGFINKKGEAVTSFIYGKLKEDEFSYLNPLQYVGYYTGGLFLVYKGNNWFYIDKDENVVFKLGRMLYYQGEFSEGLMWYSDGNYMKLCNNKGRIIKKINYLHGDTPTQFKNGYSYYRNSDYGFIGNLYDRNGNVVVSYDHRKNTISENYLNNISAQLCLANFFYDNKIYLESAFNLFLSIANTGHSYAQYVVGWMCQYGQGVKADEQRAMEWYRKSNEVDAKKQLALFEGKDNVTYSQSIDNSLLSKESLLAYNQERVALEKEKRFAQKHESMINLDSCIVMYNKATTKDDYIEAFKGFQDLADHNNPYAQLFTGWCYEQGVGVDINIERAITWYKKAAAQGNVDACFRIALIYINGISVRQSEKEALRWYKEGQYLEDLSTNHLEYSLEDLTIPNEEELLNHEVLLRLFYSIEGDEGGTTDDGFKEHNMCVLARCYETGTRGCTTINYERAIFWYEKAQKDPKAHNLGHICYRLGYLNYKGLGTKRDYKKAVSWLKQGALHHAPSCLILLGWMYEKGIGVVSDHQIAEKYYYQAKNLEKYYWEDILSFVTIEEFLSFETDLEDSWEKALYWGEIADNKKFAFMVALHKVTKSDYLKEDTVNLQIGLDFLNKKEYRRAAHHFHLAAGNNNPLAQYYMATLYEKGLGVSRNIKVAFDWYNAANRFELYNLGNKIDSLKPIADASEYEDYSVLNNYTTEKKRIALVIGNAIYASQRLDALSSPIKDARDVREKLENLGFKVRPVVENGSKNTMRKAIMDFIKEAKDYDVALFYYSGHGIQSKPGINATNYLIPSDAKLQYSESLSGECIDLNEMVLNNLSKEREGKASLVFIDACRTVLNLPSESDFGDAKGSDRELRGLNEQISPEGVCVVYATRAGSVSYDIRQKTEEISQKSLNSYFTQGLLECLDEDKDKNLPIFIQRLKDKVRAKTNGRQVPSPYNELYGDFYFDPNK